MRSTGGTGYVGGDILHHLASSPHGSSYSIACLVRGAERAEQVAKAYPKIRVVQGDLDDHKLLEDEARNADVVLNLASTSHIEGAKAIQRGLSTAKGSESPYWIQIAGGTIVAGKEVAQGKFGFESKKIYDDVNDVQEVLSLIKDNPNRAVENLVISQDASAIKTALIVGPLIYGVGRGPVNVRSVQAPELARVTLELKEGFRLGEGKNAWSNVHVRDLSAVVALLVDAAAASKPGLWNELGIYAPGNGKMVKIP